MTDAQSACIVAAITRVVEHMALRGDPAESIDLAACTIRNVLVKAFAELNAQAKHSCTLCGK